jgi:predicted RND superfamily exporter protein
MKLLVTFFVFGIFLFAAEEAKKDTDYSDLFNQLDKVISAKKNNKNLDKSKEKHEKENLSKREKNYREFNEAAKKHHIYTANELLKIVNKLIEDYENKNIEFLKVERYSSIGEKKIAYVSSEALSLAISKLERNNTTLDDLKNYKALLQDIGNFNIRTISKVIILVEQVIMNIRGLGIKKTLREKKKEVADVPMRLRESMRIDGTRVVEINKDIVKLKIDN